MPRTRKCYFKGVCSHCEREIMHLRLVRSAEDASNEWVFCDECDGITRLDKEGERFTGT